MATYVLLHGATAGGWQWRAVARLLRSAGHEVYTPTLTGLGERSHLLSREIGLATHVQDILGVLSYEDLRDVVLVGKSYSGVPVTGAAEQAPERIRHLAYLDAIVPEDGRSIIDLSGESAAPLLRAVRERGEGWLIPVDSSVPTRHTPHPFKTFTEPLELKNPAAAALPRTYIYCTPKPAGTMHARITDRSLERAKAEGWRWVELEAGHDAEQQKPEEVARLLLDLA